MAKMTIGPKHPIRALVLDLKTYMDSKGRFIDAVRAAFDDCDLDVVCEGMSGDEGRGNWVIRPKDTTSVCCDECAARMDRAAFDNYLVVTWYRLSAATIEFVAYVS
jgi:hypothetical protein